MKLTFWGAAQTVTGSLHEISVNGQRWILDCGLFQGRRSEARERNSNLPFPGDSIDGVILSHAHIDHSGNLPSLAKQGYSGPIYTTPATAGLCGYMLRDSAYLQERDAEFLNKRHSRRKKLDLAANNGPVEPLYTTENAEAILPLFKEVDYRQPTEIGDNLSYECTDAGHILGSSSVLIHHRAGSRTIRLGFSGDIGREHMPIIRDPQPIKAADYLIMESTYGGRLHQPVGKVRDKLADIVTRTCERGGKIIVPAFAVGRTQQLVLMLHELFNEKRIPNIPIFVDSPLAVNATEIYRKHPECYDAETRAFLLNSEEPFGFSRLKYIRDVNDSKALNDVRFPCVIISASGMCEGGRIIHHLKNNITDHRNTVLITGFMAAHTLGRKIVDRQDEVPIFGEPVRLRAEVVKLNELSAHADQQEMLVWLKEVAPGLKGIFLVHGEPEQQKIFAGAIEERYGVKVVIPNRGDSFELD